MNLSPDQTAWIDRAHDADILDVAVRPPISAKLRKHSREHIGACPKCGGEDRFAVNPSKKGGIFICRGSSGGHVVTMVMHVCDVDFLTACEIINGEPMPKAGRTVSAEEIKAAAEERERQRAEREVERAKEEEIYREKERGVAYDIWRAGVPLIRSPAEAYLRGRGIETLPEGLQLRYAPEVAYFHGEEKDELGRRSPRVIHRGPAMLAPIVEPVSGKFRAVHITWIDIAAPGRKAEMHDPDDGTILPAKKVRGSKAGNAIRLVDVQKCTSMYIGEGVETVLSVWLALRRAEMDVGAAFWSSVDLGNLGGKAIETWPHPTLKDASGRARRVAGPDPDVSTGIAIPESVVALVLLGDGDSDRFTTQCVLARATRRYARPGRTVRTAWAPNDMDFNDVLRAA